MSNDARRKLRDMGGIMASSPDLIQAVQKFQVGGPVMGPPPSAPAGPNFFPRTPPVAMSGIRPSSLQVPPLPGTIPIVPRELTGEARRRALAGTAPSFGMGVGLGSLNPILEDDISVEDLLSTPPTPRENQPTPRPSKAEPESDSKKPPAVERQNELRRSRNLGPMSPEQEREFLRAEVDRLRDTTDDARAARGFGRIGDIVTQVSPDPEKVKELEPKIDDLLEKTSPPPGGGGDGAGGTPTKKDLRSLYKEQLGLFKEIYGTNDEDEARDRAMSLAMIGLAIAAGQSPNALTNIAQGTMVGLQAMGDRREAGRERERGMKTLALQTAIDQMSAATEADADAARMEQEQANRLELEAFKAQLGAAYGGAAGSPGGSKDPRSIIDFTQNTYATALEGANTGEAPDFDPEIETPHDYAMRAAKRAAEDIGGMFPGYGGAGGSTTPTAPEVPTISTREEYDALPSGAKFMQNGQERIKP